MAESIVIVEDEPIIAEDIAFTLESLGYVVKDIFDNATDTLESLKLGKPDLMLLDINIEGDKDGIELAKIIKKDHKIPFVFLTSYYDDATLDRAIPMEPSGYIVKPFDKKDLKVNIELAIIKSQQIQKQPVGEKFFVKQDTELLAINQSDIHFVEAYDNYCNIYTASNKYLISHTLKSVESKLDPGRFIRVHKSYLVNYDKITSISEGFLYLNKHQISIGKVYKQELFARLSVL
ncbi:MAG: response regulator [bacterium]|nr:response regulator [bacterium]